MAADYTWLLNGIDLDALSGRLAKATLWRPPIATRRNPITIPGEHGNLDVGLPVFNEPLLTIAMRAKGVGQAEAEEAVNAVAAMITQPTLTLTRVSGGVSASAVVKLVSADMDNAFVYGVGSGPVAVFAIPGVFFRSPVTTSAELAFQSNLVSAEVATLSGSTGPIIDAVVRISGPCTNPQITDPGTGTGLSWTGSITATQYLFIQPRPLRARVSTNAEHWESGGTDVSATLGFPAAGRLQLWPVVQAATVRRVRISATGSGKTSATKLTVRAKGAYL